MVMLNEGVSVAMALGSEIKTQPESKPVVFKGVQGLHRSMRCQSKSKFYALLCKRRLRDGVITGTVQSSKLYLAERKITTYAPEKLNITTVPFAAVTVGGMN